MKLRFFVSRSKVLPRVWRPLRLHLRCFSDAQGLHGSCSCKLHSLSQSFVAQSWRLRSPLTIHGTTARSCLHPFSGTCTTQGKTFQFACHVNLALTDFRDHSFASAMRFHCAGGRQGHCGVLRQKTGTHAMESRHPGPEQPETVLNPVWFMGSSK